MGQMASCVRRCPGEEYRPECLVSTVKHPEGQMIWGCISSKGVGRLRFVKGTVNAEVYIDILKTPSVFNIGLVYVYNWL